MWEDPVPLASEQEKLEQIIVDDFLRNDMKECLKDTNQLFFHTVFINPKDMDGASVFCYSVQGMEDQIFCQYSEKTKWSNLQDVTNERPESW